MADRGSQRGGRGHRGGGGDRGGGGGRGGGRGGRDHQRGGDHGGKDGEQKERPKRDNILKLEKYVDQRMRVKFSGGREVIGTLKGFDQLMNLVLDEVEELMRDEEGTTATRKLGLIVARGPLVTLIAPEAGTEEIENPFVGGGGEGGEEED